MNNEIFRPHIRPRRNRKSNAIRAMVRENTISLDDLIAPLFVKEGQALKEPITSMPGQFRYSPDLLLKEVEYLRERGIKSFCLFPALEDQKKNNRGTESMNPHGFYPKTISMIKNRYPELIIMTDVALDPYSSDGHDGLVDRKTGEILNDETLEILGEMALVQARAGADIVGPSDMMDGRVAFIREVLDSEGFSDTSILSYTAKYASAFYGPFRDALSSAPKSGDKKTYQMDPANVREALLEAELDIAEGADMVMVKPGLPYLDVIRALREITFLPVAAYNVSGEYAMVKAAAEKGWLDGEKVMVEMLTSFKRAGADIILTYFAKDMGELLSQ